MKDLIESTKTKHKDVIAVVYKAMAENPNKKMSELYEIARNMPAPRFYTHVSYARNMVSRLDRGVELPVMNQNKVDMYKELHRRLVEARGNKKKCYNLLHDIIETPAPCFYMELISFKNTFYKAIKNRK